MTRIIRVIDYETTGFPDNTASEIIELGRIDVDIASRTVGNPWRSFARPSGPIPPEVKAVHHILEEEVAGAPPLTDLWSKFLEGCGEHDILAAHNTSFEMHFYGGGGRRWIDTYKCALTIWPDAPSHSNQTLRYWLGIDQSPEFDRGLAMPPHRALPDAYVTAHILVKLMSKCDVIELVAISGKPALLSRLNFGKHRGMKYSEAPADYLQWIRDKSELSEDVKFSAAYWLQRR